MYVYIYSSFIDSLIRIEKKITVKQMVQGIDSLIYVFWLISINDFKFHSHKLYSAETTMYWSLNENYCIIATSWNGRLVFFRPPICDKEKKIRGVVSVGIIC